MKRKLPLLLSAILTFFVFNSKATIVTVTQQDNTFSPKDVNAKVGDTVRWVWTSGLHTTTSTDIPAGAASWDSQLSTDIRQFDYKITVVGTYNYICTPHVALGMVGTITATAALGIDNKDIALSAKIYPNPARENAVLNLTTEKPGKGILAMYDLVGNQIVKRDISLRQGNNDVMLPLENMHPGIYFVELKYSESTIVRRFVKSN